MAPNISGCDALISDALMSDGFLSDDFLPNTFLSKVVADPLFMSRCWRQSWWEIWGARAGGPVLLACEDEHGPLAVAPLYQDSLRWGRYYHYTRLQMMGCSYGTLSTPRAEYNSFLLRNGHETAAFAALAQRLEPMSWQEMVLQDVIVGSVMDTEVRAWCHRRGWLLREIQQDHAYAVNTEGAFTDYLRSRGSNTRLKLFHRRKVLAGLGAPQLSNLFPERVEVFFELLNGFHRQRWGRDCFGADSLRFHTKLIERLSRQGAGIELSLLSLDNTPLSVLYNIRYGDRVYNLQSGYHEHFHPKISLGTLHLGYAIEASFHSAPTRYFDMLAGGGKHGDYKRSLANETTSLISYKIVRGRSLRALYWLKDKMG